MHFIPLSTTYREIYNIVAYFSGPTPSMVLAANLSSSSMTATFSSSSTLSPSSSSSSDEEDADADADADSWEVSQDQEVLRRGRRQKGLTSVDADRRLKRIARAGKEWKRTMGRKVDMEGRCSFLFLFLREC